MMRKSTRLLVLIGVVVSLMVATTVSASNAMVVETAGVHATKPPNLSGKSVRLIATEADLGQVPLFYAENLLRKWGANVNHIEAGSTAVAVAGVAGGQADVVNVSPLAGLGAVVNGLNMRAFAMTAPRTDDVFVSKASITSLQQVRGAKVGVLSLNSLNGIELGLALKRGGLSISDVEVIAAGGQSVRVGAFLAGRLDAGPISFDNYKAALRSEGFRILYNYMTQSPGLTKALLWAKPEWIAANRDLAVALNRAVIQGFRWANNPKNRAAFVRLATTRMRGLDPAAAGAAFDDFRRYKVFPDNAIMTRINLLGNMSSFTQYDLISRTLPVEQWADVSFAKTALTNLGVVKKKTP